MSTRDGGFAALGLAVDTSNPDAYVVKIDANGKTEWTKRFGGSGTDMILGGVEKNNGSLFLGGLTSSNDGFVTGFRGGPVSNQKVNQFPDGKGSRPKSDAWLVELNGN